MLIPLLAFILTALLTPAIIKLAKISGFLDRPEGRKTHEKPVPPLGGIVIFSVFLLFTVFFEPLHWSLYIALPIILIVGLLDDSFDINAKLKFAMHFAVAFILVLAGGAQLNTLGNILGLGELYMGLTAIPFTVACVVYIQNALNMMDGVDGLASGQSLIIFGWLMGIAFISGQTEIIQHIGLLVACILGFWLYNMRYPLLKRARIFLGDAGSMALGIMVAWYAITLSQNETILTATPIRPIVFAWLIALPIVDSFGLLVARLKDKKHPFAPDRRHFHHHFLNAGFTPRQTTLIILTYSTLLGAISYFGILNGIPEYILGWGWILLWIGHTILTIKSEKFVLFLKRIKN